MNKNFFLTLIAIAVMTTIGYAAYNNGSITDLSNVINNKLGALTSEYLSSIVTTKTKVGGTKEVVSLDISADNKLKPQNVVAGTEGTTGFTVASFNLSAKKSSDDIIVSSLTFIPNVSGKGSKITDVLTNCQLSADWGTSSNYIGSVADSDLSSREVIFKIDNTLTVQKGTDVGVSVRCVVKKDTNLASGTSFRFSMKGSPTSVIAKPMLFDKPVSVRFISAQGPNMTLRSKGELQTTLNTTASKARNLSCGATVHVVSYKLTSKYEDINVGSIKFKRSGSAPIGVVKRIVVQDNLANTLGEGSFETGGMSYTSASSSEVTVNFNQQFTVPKDGNKSIFIMAELSSDICRNAKGKTVAIDFNGVARGVGVVSGSEVVSNTKISGPKNSIR